MELLFCIFSQSIHFCCIERLLIFVNLFFICYFAESVYGV
jgi:hypothetical protein